MIKSNKWTVATYQWEEVAESVWGLTRPVHSRAWSLYPSILAQNMADSACPIDNTTTISGIKLIYKQLVYWVLLINIWQFKVVLLQLGYIMIKMSIFKWIDKLVIVKNINRLNMINAW